MLVSLPLAAAEQAIVLGSTIAPESSNSPMLLELLTRSFAQVGYTVSIEQLPAERSLVLANEGRIDGDAARVAGLEKSYPNLVMVPEELGRSAFVAYSLKNSPPIRSFDDITTQRIIIPRGFKIVELAVMAALDPAQIVLANNTDAAMLMLLAGHGDLVITMKVHADVAIQKSDVAQEEFMLHGPPLIEAPFYIYLHKKHSALIMPLAAALRAVKDDLGY